MASGISGLLNTAQSSLEAQSQSIRLLGNNIANVNTEGYNRRRVDLETRAANSTEAGTFGSGVQVGGTTRIADAFLDNNLLARIQEQARSSVRDEFLERAEVPFSLNDSITTIGSAMAEFFAAIEDLKVDPSDVGLRTDIISKGQELTKVIRDTYSTISTLQREADDRIGFGVGEVNRITENIAALNLQISQSEQSGSQQNLALRDQRDQALRDLSEYVSFSHVESSDGAVTVSLPSGFALVNGTNQRELEFLPAPSFGAFPRGLDGALLGNIVYDFDRTAGGTSHINLNDEIAAGEGELAGLFSLRGVQATADVDIFDGQGDLIEIAKRVEAISIELLTNFNSAFRGDDLSTGAFEGDDPLTVGIIESDSVRRDILGNAEKVPDAFAAFGLLNRTSEEIDSGLLVAGDRRPDYVDDLQQFLTDTGVQSFSDLLEFKLTRPEEFAAALDADGLTPGTAEMADGDARNIDRILAFRDNQAILPVGALGSYSPSTPIAGIYTEAVTLVGGLRASARGDLEFKEARAAQAVELRNATSGVNIDEEFASLIDFQKIFEASARLIRVGDELFDELVRLI